MSTRLSANLIALAARVAHEFNALRTYVDEQITKVHEQITTVQTTPGEDGATITSARVEDGSRLVLMMSDRREITVEGALQSAPPRTWEGTWSDGAEPSGWWDCGYLSASDGGLGVLHLDFTGAGWNTFYLPDDAPVPTTHLEAQPIGGGTIWIEAGERVVHTSNVIPERKIVDLIGIFKTVAP